MRPVQCHPENTRPDHPSQGIVRLPRGEHFQFCSGWDLQEPVSRVIVVCRIPFRIVKIVWHDAAASARP